ncbi:glycosyltransferase [Sulfitobacter dubius]|uniref:glycosyltransferase n=1 Tax=Sulfitobacter dubius TaxID=218673 RepID=UPI0008E489B9|nr:glycosyltransferase [Sulfitobacter dubius]SFH10909.1 Glycosyltransferase involved in cell wall bisynthesis [Sulfitobacter dubius]
MSAEGQIPLGTGRNVALTERASGQRVSVIMANYNCAPYLVRAIQSVLDQTHGNLELLISDDGSSDDSLAVVRKAMSRDARVLLICAAAATGPGPARNRAFDAATGDWIAICDADDIMHPERLERLLRAAHALEADMLADDLIYFGKDPLERHKTLLQKVALQVPQVIDAVTMASGTLCGVRNLSLGYLKPLIRRSALGGLRYDSELTIDEDYDLYLRLLVSGARFVVIPDAMYLYRRHAKSISHRLNVDGLKSMVQAQAAFIEGLGPEQHALSAAVARRMKGHAVALQYAYVLEVAKAGNWLGTAARLLRSPRSLWLFGKSLRERLHRRRARMQAAGGRMDLVLCKRGGQVPPEASHLMKFEVPEVSAAVWSPSAAQTWAHLAGMACEHELHIQAADRAGEFALGLVPQFASAEVSYSPLRQQSAAPARKYATRILYLSHDLDDPATWRRVSMLTAGGALVDVAGFRRQTAPLKREAVVLGQTKNGKFLHRGHSALRLFLRCEALPGEGAHDVILARNLEMLPLAHRISSRSEKMPRLVYEVLDIHRLLVGRGLVSSILRAVERYLCRGVARVLISSPRFETEYFRPHGQLSAPTLLVENKIWHPDRADLPLPPPRKMRPYNGSLVIGWFGVLRCAQSLRCLDALCRGTKGRVRLVLRGRPALDALPQFNRIVAGNPYIEFHGAYRYPEDLAEIYGGIDIAWLVDRFDARANSDWLLPNRLYESCGYGAVPLGLAGTEAGSYLARRGLGLCLHDLNHETLAAQLTELDDASLAKARARVAAVGREQWHYTRQDCARLVQELAGETNRARPIALPLSESAEVVA